MKNKEFINKLMDLVIESDNSIADWKNGKYLRRNFILFLVTMTFLMIVSYIINVIPFESSPTLSLLFRSIILLLDTMLIIILLSTSYSYYKFVLINKNKIYISNVITFYLINAVLFGNLYFSLYSLDKFLFIYPNPSFIPQAIIMKISEGLIKSKIEFLIFSGIHGINGSYNKIESNSILISFISWIQSLYVLSLITLCVSSFINQNVSKI